MSQIFISYAKEDKAAAKMLHRDLSKLGYQVWLDAVSLVGGQNWEHEIKKAIGESLFFIALISAHSITKKGYVQKELKEALKVMELLPENEIYIIPVRLDNSMPTYDKLRGIHWIDIYVDWELGLKEIDRAIYLQRPDIKKSLTGQPEIFYVDINDVVEWAVAITNAGNNNKIDIIFKPSESSAIIRGNPNYLRQAILNVILNAVDFTYVYEENRRPWVDVKIVSSEGLATIAIENCGTPITDKEIGEDLCFQPFYVGTNATKEGHDGTGLGLAISRKIVEMFNGSITIKSLPAATKITGSREIQPYVTTVRIQFPLSSET